MKVSIDKLASLVFDQGYRVGWEQGRNMEMAFPGGKAEREQHTKVTAERDRLVAEVKTLRAKLERSQQQASDFVQTIDDNDKRLRDAEERVWPGQTHGCDAPEWMADEIEALRAQLVEAEKDRDQWRSIVGDNIDATQEKQIVEKQIVALQEQLATWSESGELMQVEIATLRGQLADAKREAAEEFAERQVLQAEASGDNAELERLREFVGKMKKWEELGGIYGSIHFGVYFNTALAELDASSTATETEPEDEQAVEPSLCQKCQDLQLEVEELQGELQHLATATAYKGNTVIYWYQKANAYSKALSDLGNLAGDGGELERLRKFVGKISEAWHEMDSPLGNPLVLANRVGIALAAFGWKSVPVTKSTEQNGGAE